MTKSQIMLSNILSVIIQSFLGKNNEYFSSLSFLLDNNKTIRNTKVWHRRAKRNLIPHEIYESPFLYYLKREEDPVNKAIEKKVL